MRQAPNSGLAILKPYGVVLLETCGGNEARRWGICNVFHSHQATLQYNDITITVHKSCDALIVGHCLHEKPHSLRMWKQFTVNLLYC
jgi:hypothetical protein